MRHDDFGGAIGRLRSYKILFVPGFLSDVVIAAGSYSLMEKIKAGQYFDEQLAWMKEAGIDAERVVIESEESPKHNASVIAAAVRAAGKPVIIVSHSKGGLDTLEALVSDAGLPERIRGWIPIQAPFLGSPVADDIVGRAFLRGPAFALMRSLEGSEKSLVSMTAPFRAAYYERHRDRISELLGPRSPTRIICFASWQENEPFRIDTFLELSRDAMAKRGIENDGLVPWKSAILPGCAYAAVSGIDHAVPVMATNERPFDRVRFTKTLLSLLLARMEPEWVLGPKIP